MPKVGREKYINDRLRKVHQLFAMGFDDFRVLRAIGRGAFGKVCIVEKKDTKQMYAMKYMSKAACIEKDAVRNVLREMDILMDLDHTFLVNLWFTFQDEEDLFVVVDLLLGGDFRYHLQQGTKFTEEVVRFYVGEIALALEYLKEHRIIHRDIKPDNLLLDGKGHVHLTDFNVATVVEDENTLATSMSGTKPYMAPEIFKTSLGKSRGYNHAVDWWSVGITMFEILRGKRPYQINSQTNLSDVIQMFESSCLMFPSSWSKNFKNLIRQLLNIDPKARLDSVEKLKECELMQSLDWELLCRKEITIPFIPSKDHLNCDPTYELEEMIIEPKPLHKKKKRLAKQNSNKVDSRCVQLTPMQMKLDSLGKKFKPYNREREKLIAEQKHATEFGDDTIPEEDEAAVQEFAEIQSNDTVLLINPPQQPSKAVEEEVCDEQSEVRMAVVDVEEETENLISKETRISVRKSCESLKVCGDRKSIESVGGSFECGKSFENRKSDEISGKSLDLKENSVENRSSAVEGQGIVENQESVENENAFHEIKETAEGEKNVENRKSSESSGESDESYKSCESGKNFETLEGSEKTVEKQESIERKSYKLNVEIEDIGQRAPKEIDNSSCEDIVDKCGAYGAGEIASENDIASKEIVCETDNASAVVNEIENGEESQVVEKQGDLLSLNENIDSESHADKKLQHAAELENNDSHTYVLSTAV